MVQGVSAFRLKAKGNICKTLQVHAGFPNSSHRTTLPQPRVLQLNLDFAVESRLCALWSTNDRGVPQPFQSNLVLLEDPRCPSSKHRQGYVSVRQKSLHNPMPWMSWGSPIMVLGLGVGYKKSLAFRGLSQNTIMVPP